LLIVSAMFSATRGDCGTGSVSLRRIARDTLRKQPLDKDDMLGSGEVPS